MTIALFPTNNCKVMLADGGIGLIRGRRPEKKPNEFLVKRPDRTEQWVLLDDITNGFDVNNSIYHRPPQRLSASLGFGQIVAKRDQMGLTQMLVTFADSGETRWLDWRTLAQAHPLKLESQTDLQAHSLTTVNVLD